MQVAWTPRFTSRIEFVDGQAFNQAAKNATMVGWGIDKRQLNLKKAVTYRASICTVTGITNGQQVNLYHIIPVKFNLTEDKEPLGKYMFHIFTKIFSEIAELLPAHKPKRALVIGTSTAINDSETSIAMLPNVVQKALQMSQTPYSKFIGQPRWGVSNVIYNGQTDTWTIHATSGPMSYVKDTSSLTRFYREIHLAPDDTLWINGQQVDAKFVNQS